MHPIYLELIDQLAEAPCLYGDDSPTRVLKMKADEDPAEGGEGLFAQVNRRLGRRALKAEGSGHKMRLSISVVSGQMVAGVPRSWIFPFRTHFGDLGNLLSRILQARRRKNRQIKIQSDLAGVNKLEKMISQCFEVIWGGCGVLAAA